MRFAELKKGVIYTDKKGRNRYLVLNDTVKYDAHEGYYATRVTPGGNRILVLTEAWSSDGSTMSDDELIRAAESVKIPEGRFQFRRSSTGSLAGDLPVPEVPARTAIHLVTLASLAGEQRAVKDKIRRELEKQNESWRLKKEARETAENRQNAVLAQVRGIVGEEAFKYSGNHHTDLSPVSVPVGVLEKLVDLAKSNQNGN